VKKILTLPCDVFVARLSAAPAFHRVPIPDAKEDPVASESPGDESSAACIHRFSITLHSTHSLSPLNPVLPAFTGFVPDALRKVYPDAKITTSTSWDNAFNSSFCCNYRVDVTGNSSCHHTHHATLYSSYGARHQVTYSSCHHTHHATIDPLYMKLGKLYLDTQTKLLGDLASGLNVYR
jgi:hypothetical protein